MKLWKKIYFPPNFTCDIKINSRGVKTSNWSSYCDMMLITIVIILKYVDERFLFEMLDVREKMNLSELGRDCKLLCWKPVMTWAGRAVGRRQTRQR